jgi:hypothetical protein
MFSLEVNFLVQQEQHKDRLRNIERRQLLQAVDKQPNVGLTVYRKAAGWLGDRLVTWGAKLQSYDVQSPANNVLAEGRH